MQWNNFGYLDKSNGVHNAHATVCGVVRLSEYVLFNIPFLENYTGINIGWDFCWWIDVFSAGLVCEVIRKVVLKFTPGIYRALSPCYHAAIFSAGSFTKGLFDKILCRIYRMKSVDLTCF